MPMNIIPLFPLGLVLFPELPLPLHIFEERYKNMIDDCIQGDLVFGINWYEGGNLHRVGCAASVVKVLQRRDDGSLDILVKGVRRYKIEKILDEKMYLQARVVYFEDEPGADSLALDALSAKSIDLMGQIAVQRNQEIDLKDFADMSPELISFMIAGGAGFNENEEQTLLELTSTRARLEKLVDSLYKVYERIKITEEIQKIVRKNGLVPKELTQQLKDLQL